MIQQHTDTYWTNSFGSRFLTEEAALKDEQLRSSAPLRLACGTAGIADFESKATTVVGGLNGVWGNSAPHARLHRVYLFTDLLAYCQKLIEIHGENAGWMVVNQGNGHTGNRVVKIEPNPLYPKT